MANIDPFSSEKVVGNKIVLVPTECIPSTVLDDSPTFILSDPIIVPNGDAELVFLVTLAATVSPTSAVMTFQISFDGTNYFDMDFATGSWADVTVVAASMPYAGAIAKGRVVAPYCKLLITGVGTDATNMVTAVATVTRIPETLEPYV